MTLEKDIERKFVAQAKKLGCECTKFSNPVEIGAPDRLIHMPGGYAFYVEFKRPGGKLSEHQKQYINRLRHKFIDVFVIDSWDAAMKIIDNIRS